MDPRTRLINGLLYDQDRRSLGFVTRDWKTDYFRRWSLQGVWPPIWIDSPSGNIRPRRPAVR